METKLDQNIINLAKAIRNTESNGDFQAKGGSGEYGAYQFMPKTWNEWSTKFGINTPLEQSTKEQQNEVAYKQIKEWKEQGYNPAQIASMWNSGKPEWEGNVGVNKSGIKFDTPQYVDSVTKAYQAYKSGQEPAQLDKTLSTVGNTQKGEIPTEEKTLGGFGSNIVSSTGNLISGIGKAVTHPVETIKTLGQVGAGAIQSIPGVSELYPNSENNQLLQENKDKFQGLVDFFGKRYGGSTPEEVIKNIGNTAYNDPVGFLLDLSTVLGGGGSALSKAGEVSNIGKVAKAGEIVSKTGEVINPINIGGKAIGGVIGTTGKATKSALTGTLGETTGEGASAIEQGLKATPEFRAGIRGQINPEQVLNETRQGISQIAQKRGEEFTKNLEELKKANPQSLDISPAIKEFDSQASNYGIKIGENGQVDLSRSSLVGYENKVQAVKNMLDDWGTQAGDRTITGVDLLKKNLNNLKEAGHTPFNSFIDKIIGKVRNVAGEVKGYNEMEASYASKSDFLKQLDQVFGSNNTETALNKLTSVLRTNKEFRTNLLQELDLETGKNISGKIAGLQMSSFIPKHGLLPRTAPLVVGGATIANPMLSGLLPILASASPRIVGEVINALGLTGQQLNKFKGLLSEYNTSQIVKSAMKGGYYGTQAKNQNMQGEEK